MRKDDDTRRNPAGRPAPTRLWTFHQPRQQEMQHNREVERRRGGREDYGNGSSRKFAIREDEGGYSDE
jgi:hypothetical protein